MADETNDDKVKQTVPFLMRTAKGIADHAQAVQDMQYDSDRKAFRDPRVAMLALFAYARLTATLLHEAEERLTKEQAAFAKRIAEFETRLTTVERWKTDAELQGAEMAKGLEEMLAGGDGPPLDQIRALLNGTKKEPVTTSTPLPSGVVAVMDSTPMSTIVSLKPGEAKRTTVEEKREGKKGGAA
jgi:hypothetical protein